MSRTTIALLVTIVGSLIVHDTASAQITAPRSLSAAPNRIATAQEQLTNQLRATGGQQRAFIAFLIQQVRRGRLDLQLVMAVKRKAITKNRFFPFPFFERAIRFEAAKRQVILPPVQAFAPAAPVGAGRPPLR